MFQSLPSHGVSEGNFQSSTSSCHSPGGGAPEAPNRVVEQAMGRAEQIPYCKLVRHYAVGTLVPVVEYAHGHFSLFSLLLVQCDLRSVAH